MTHATYADVYKPAALKNNIFLYNLVLVLTGSFFIALCAQISIPVPFSPVPITGQTFAVMLIGAVLGSKRGFLAVMAYLTEGAAGMPVFAGGAFGVAHLVGPTGGYLMGMPIAAFVIGFLSERGFDRSILTSVLAMIIGTAVIFGFGLMWLVKFTGKDMILAAGLIPFLPGAVVKLALAASILPLAWRFTNKH